MAENAGSLVLTELVDVESVLAFGEALELSLEVDFLALFLGQPDDSGDAGVSVGVELAHGVVGDC